MPSSLAGGRVDHSRRGSVQRLLYIHVNLFRRTPRNLRGRVRGVGLRGGSAAWFAEHAA